MLSVFEQWNCVQKEISISKLESKPKRLLRCMMYNKEIKETMDVIN
jgi:hypothetical protein